MKGWKGELFEDWKFNNDVWRHGTSLYGMSEDELWDMYINRKGTWVWDGKDHLVPDNTPREQYFQDHMFDVPFIPYEDYLAGVTDVPVEAPVEDVPVEDVPVEDVIPEETYIPTPVTPQDDYVSPDAHEPEIKDVHLTTFENYLLMEHYDKFMDEADHPNRIEHMRTNFAHDDAGNIVLGGDEMLEAELGLGPAFHAVTAPTGEVVTMFDPSAENPP
jgi:hypothetical protein